MIIFYGYLGMKRNVIAVLLLFMHMPVFSQSREIGLIDQRATKETQALFYNLKKLSKKHILFGH